MNDRVGPPVVSEKGTARGADERLDQEPTRIRLNSVINPRLSVAIVGLILLRDLTPPGLIGFGAFLFAILVTMASLGAKLPWNVRRFIAAFVEALAKQNPSLPNETKEPGTAVASTQRVADWEPTEEELAALTADAKVKV